MNLKKNNNYIAVNALGVKGKIIYKCRKSKHCNRKNVVNLLLIDNEEKRHYTVIKYLSRLLGSSNSKHESEQYSCLNYLQGFHSEESRDNHFEYYKDNEAVRIEMLEEDLFVWFHYEQNQFKAPFIMYGDFEANLKPIEGPRSNQERSYTKEINEHVPSGFCMNSVFAYGRSKIQ